MDQMRSHGMGMQPRMPMVSGTEEHRPRTGVAYRTTAQSTPMKKPTAARMESSPNACTGVLPGSAPLANPYVPFQREDAERYPMQRALARGTLYPGLDLPLMGMVNGDKAMTPMAELMALQFALTELKLYLDMHPEDSDALAVFRDYAARTAAAKAEYEAKHGPLLSKNAGTKGKWDWINDPWPWEFCQEG